MTRSQVATIAAARRAARPDPDAAIAAWTGEHDASQLAATLQAARVAAFPLLTALDIITDPHHQHRGEHFELCATFPAERLLDGNSLQLSAARPLLRRAAPQPGAHNEQVCGELLRLSLEEVRGLQQAGVIA